MKRYFLLFIILCMLLSCSTNKRLQLTSDSITGLVGTEALSKNKENTFEYKTLLIPKYSAELKLHDGQKSFKGSIRIVKDKIIYITVTTAMGIEVMRIMTTPDSIMIIDRYNKNYFKGNFNFINYRWGINLNYSTLEACLSNRVFKDPSNKTEKLQVNKNGDEYQLTYSEDDNSYIFTLNDLGELLQSIVNNSSQMGMTFDYSNFEISDKKKFPHSYEIYIRNNEQTNQLSLSFKKITFDSEIKTPFNIPSGYKELVIDNK